MTARGEKCPSTGLECQGGNIPPPLAPAPRLPPRNPEFDGLADALRPGHSPPCESPSPGCGECAKIPRMKCFPQFLALLAVVAAPVALAVGSADVSTWNWDFARYGVLLVKLVVGCLILIAVVMWAWDGVVWVWRRLRGDWN